QRLADAGVVGDGPRASPSWRWWRWVSELADDRVAFVAENDAAWARLRREQALLERLRGAGFDAPVVLAVRERFRVQVRRKIPGATGCAVEDLASGGPSRSVSAASRYSRELRITPAGETLARDLGCALAHLHRAIPADEALALGFQRVDYAALLDSIDARLA